MIINHSLYSEKAAEEPEVPEVPEEPEEVTMSLDEYYAKYRVL